jgi:ubiquinone/menaquinone biosynthesis C-methylase UbiE
MGYLPPAPPMQQPADGAAKYVGAVADGYDAKRETSEKWKAEQRLVEEFLSNLPENSTVLDIPVGTGRFLPFYLNKGYRFIGMDTSGDMIVQALLKVAEQKQVEAFVTTCNQSGRIVPAHLDDGRHVITQADVRAIPMPDKMVDAAVMVRLTRWLEPGDCQVAFRQLQRVSRRRVIWTARVSDHPHARPVSLFEQALGAEWRITRNEAGHEPQYRILMAER